MTIGGYHGVFLEVDLSGPTFAHRPLSPRILRDYVGGSGLGARLLWEAHPASEDPLSPRAALVVALSPLVGTPLTTSAKFAVVATSPLTGRICDALASDRFAIELKRTGMDALVLRGAASRWSLLRVDKDRVSLEGAEEFLGLSSAETESRLQAREGGSHRFFGIGPAGEAQVRYATISGDGRHAGRGGLGAILGAKRLKGILVRGDEPTPLFDAARVLSLSRDLSARSLGPGTAKYRTLGTVANLLVMNRLGTLPARNFQQNTIENAEEISGEAFHALEGRVRKHCAACAIGCEHVFPRGDGSGVRLEYEGLFALGPLCGIQDREAILQAASRCDALGLDVISAGGTIAFAMECRERGLLAEGPVFGDAAGMLQILDEIGARSTRRGDLLAEGSRVAASRIGGGAERFACHVKGMELPGYEPRALQSMAVGLATSSRGADHNRSGAYEEDFRGGLPRRVPLAEKGRAAARSEDRAALLDSLILCKFLRGVFEDLFEESADMLSAVTGWDVTGAELRRTASRIVTLKKLFNVREGWLRQEDTLPERFLSEPLPGGPVAGARLERGDLDRMIAAYYLERGWREDGLVPRPTSEALGLEEALVGPYLVEESSART